MKKNFQLTELKANQLIELEGWEQKQKEVVEANPFIPINDPKSYDQAKKNRTALKSARTEVEKQDRLIGSTLSNFRKDTKAVAENLISITKPHEERQQEEVSRYEEILEERKNEKERLEKERVGKIQEKIQFIETFMKTAIDKMTFETIGATEDVLKSDSVVVDFDFEEFQVLFDNMTNEHWNFFNQNKEKLQQEEADRIERERLEEENKKQQAELEELRAEKQKNIDIQNQKNRIFEIQEGLLDKIHQMNVNNYVAEKVFIARTTEPGEDLLPENETDWNVMSSRVLKTLTEKVDLIKEEVKKLAEQKEKEDEIKKERFVARKTLLIGSFGYELKENGFFVNEKIASSINKPMIESLSDEDWENNVVSSIAEGLKNLEEEKVRQEKLKIDKIKLLGVLEDASDELVDNQIKFENEEMQPLFLDVKEIIEKAFHVAHNKVKNF